MNSAQNRREFLKAATAAGVGAWIAAPDLFAADKSPNEQLNIACIGVGGKGDSDSHHAAAVGNVVAICDIDDDRLDKKAQKLRQARKFNDFRRLLEEMENQIDAVTVSTPDHTHAAAAMLAIKLKKHVYCQKPLTYSVYEARALREAAKKYGVCTQMGNQGTALDGSRTSIEVLRSGAIGAVREVHVWTDRCGPFWKQAPDIVARPKDTPPVPPNVHWDLFLGPAPERPYSPAYHPFAWRGWRDFGTGALGDMGCHNCNMAFMALKLQYPTSVVSHNSEVNPETYQQWATITFEFPSRNGQPPVKFIWWEGMRDGKRNLPSPEIVDGQHLAENGLFFIGDKGKMYCPDPYGAVYKLLPAKDFEGFTEPARTLPRHGQGDNDLHQKQEWIAACKANKPELALANFDYAGLLTEAVLLGNVAILAGKRIDWDGPNLKVTNAPEAQKFIHREYRKGWTL